jgi:hypothetical protein
LSTLPIVSCDEGVAAEQDRVHDGEHGDIEANGERQHGDGREREHAIAPQSPQREAQVVEETGGLL